VSPRFALGAALLLGPAAAAERPGPFHALGDNTLDAFTGGDALLHLAGVAATPPLIVLDVDADVHSFFAARPTLGQLSWPARVGGGVLPGLVGVPMLIWGDDEDVAGAWAVVQSAGLTVAYVSVLKAFTGRPGPTLEGDPAEQSREFQWGFLRNGIVEGWPSGHVAVTTATMSTLVAYYPDSTWLPWVAGGTVAYMIYGVSSFDRGQMHWFSDAVAGLFMGYAIGHTVGERFRADVDGVSAPPPTVRWRPWIDGDTVGLGLSWTP
jgi:hypothetical protein